MAKARVKAQPGARLAADAAPAAQLEKAAPPAGDVVIHELAPPRQAVEKRSPKRVISLPDEAYPEGTTKVADDFSDGDTANPFDERDWRVVLNAWAGFGLRVILVLSTAFGINQYLVMRDESRVQRTLELVELWEKPEYQMSQRALRTRIDALNEQNQAMLGNQPSQFEREVYFKQIGMKAMRADGGKMPLPEFSEHFERVVYFLNRVAFCVKENLCSERISDAFFRDYAESFWRYFGGHVAAERKAGSVNFATEIENYVLGGDQAGGGSNLPPPATP